MTVQEREEWSSEQSAWGTGLVVHEAEGSAPRALRAVFALMKPEVKNWFVVMSTHTAVITGPNTVQAAHGLGLAESAH